jgi:four helix bundle protein
MHSFRRLTVWKKAHELALRVYRVADQIPHRRFAELTLRLREIAAAAPAHIARGSASDEPDEFARALDLASGAARALDYQLLLAAELQAMERSEYTRLNARIDQICVMLAALRRTILRDAGSPMAGRSAREADARTTTAADATSRPVPRPPRPAREPSRHRRPDRSRGA